MVFAGFAEGKGTEEDEEDRGQVRRVILAKVLMGHLLLESPK